MYILFFFLLCIASGAFENPNASRISTANKYIGNTHTHTQRRGERRMSRLASKHSLFTLYYFICMYKIYYNQVMCRTGMCANTTNKKHDATIYGHILHILGRFICWCACMRVCRMCQTPNTQIWRRKWSIFLHHNPMFNFCWSQSCFFHACHTFFQHFPHPRGPRLSLSASYMLGQFFSVVNCNSHKLSDPIMERIC